MRRETDEPVEYIRDYTRFLGCKIDLSKKPLIPRPETEFWAAKAIAQIKGRNLRILDIFAGSGCIGIAVLKNCPGAVCDFTDIDKKAIEQIKINLYYNFNGRQNCKIIQSDVFSNVEGTYDYIFANPPYVAISRKNEIQKSVWKYEPKQALLGGKDGLLYIIKFLKKAGKHLNKNGKIFMEFDSSQKKDIKKLIGKFGYLSYNFYKDQYGKWRWVVIK